MEAVLFFGAALGALGGAIGVVAMRNPFYSVLALIVHLFSLAVLFLLLSSAFVAAAQVVVYAGAVMVLFLFIIMLLDLKAEERRKINIPAYAGGGLVAVAFIAQLYLVLQRFPAGDSQFPQLAQDNVNDVHNVGTTLFATHNLPFQVIGVLILVATIGVVVLSKRELK